MKSILKGVALVLSFYQIANAADVDKTRISYNSFGLSIEGSSSGGYVDNTDGKYKKSKDGTKYTYTTSTKGTDGAAYSEKISVDWAKDSYAIFSSYFETKDASGVLEGRYFVASDPSTYYKTCSQNVKEKQAAVKAGKKMEDQLRCTLVTPDLCSAYQEKFNAKTGLTADEFKKCQDFYTLIASRKNEAIKTLDVRSRENMKQTGVDMPQRQSYGDTFVNVYEDIGACIKLASLQGKPYSDMGSFETPLQRAERAKFTSDAIAAAKAAAKAASGASGGTGGGTGGANAGSGNGQK